MNAFDAAWSLLKGERGGFRRKRKIETAPEVSIPEEEPKEEGPPLAGRLRAAQIQLDAVNRNRLKRGEEEIGLPDYLIQTGLWDEYVQSDLYPDFTQSMGDSDAFVPVSDVVKPKRQESDDPRFDYVVGN